MRICQSHWDKTRAAIDARGLTTLVANSAEDFAAKMDAALQAIQDGEVPAAQNFDPLSELNWDFCGRVMHRVGLWIMRDRKQEDGMPINKDAEGFNHVCPLCVVQNDFNLHNTETGKCWNEACTIVVKPGEQAWDELWIENGADAMFSHARELNLVPLQ